MTNPKGTRPNAFSPQFGNSHFAAGYVVETQTEDNMKIAKRELPDQPRSEPYCPRKPRRSTPRATVKLEIRSLWRMLVPIADNDGIVFSERHHGVFRKKVISKSGGLTGNPAADGAWKDNGRLYRERMIPIEFLATDGQADEIAAFAREHYRQIEIQYCVISNHVRKATESKAPVEIVRMQEAEVARLSPEFTEQTIPPAAVCSADCRENQ
jgi:hypothetical protein